MYPVLFEIGSFQVHAYGLMLAISFLFGIWFASKRAEKRGLEGNAVMDVGFYLILSAIIGARLYYVILKWDTFQNDLLSIINPFQNGQQVGIGGLVMYGGFIGAIIAGILYFRIRKLPFLPYADTVAPSIGIGIFLTRIGCFLNGCCYGAPTESSLGVQFPESSPAGQYQNMLEAAQHAAETAGEAHIHLYPSQLFLSGGGLAIAIIVLIAGRKRLFDGFEFYLTGLLYSLLRFLVDFTRFYGETERLGPLSHNQVVCIVLFIIFAGLIIRPLIFKDTQTSDQSNEQKVVSHDTSGAESAGTETAS